MALEGKSGDYKSQWASSSGDHEHERATTKTKLAKCTLVLWYTWLVIVTYRCNFSTWRVLWSRCGPNLLGSEPPPCILRRRQAQEIVKIRLPLLPPNLISTRGFVLQDSPDRKLHIMFSRRTYRINSNSPKKVKAGGQNNPLLLNSHTQYF